MDTSPTVTGQDDAGAAGPSSPPAMRSAARIVMSTYVGNTIEWFDFYIYGIASALYFPAVFFTSSSPLVGSIISFGTLASGFLARPIGGVIGGHFGDRYGRKRVLVTSIVVMGASTFAVGILPGHATIGLAAPILLVFCRILQGLAAGAEWGGGTLMLIEHFGGRRRGFWGSIGATGVYCGGVLATLVFAVINHYSTDVEAFWWRLPFLASALLVILGLWIRLGVAETPVFKAAQEAQAAKRSAAKVPILEVLARYKREALIAIALSAGIGVAYQIYITYGIAYTRAVKGDVGTLLNFQTIIGVAAFVLTPLFGWLSDIWGRKLVAIGGLVVMTPFIFLAYNYLGTGSAGTLLVMLLLAEVGHSAAYGPQGAFMSELFDTRARYTGVSIGYQVGNAFAGFAPLIAASLLAAAGGPPNVGWVPMIVLVTSVLAIIAVAFSPNRQRGALTDVD